VGPKKSWIKYVPSCWPPHFAVAPFTDYSMLDTCRALLHADCSALHIARPALVTDLTRRPTLDALCLLRIAPLATQCARAGHGSLRARIAPCSALGTPPRSRIAPYSTLSALRPARIAPRLTLCTLCLLRISPLSAFSPPCRSTDFSVL